jgi:hypothetical protein
MTTEGKLAQAQGEVNRQPDGAPPPEYTPSSVHAPATAQGATVGTISPGAMGSTATSQQFGAFPSPPGPAGNQGSYFPSTTPVGSPASQGVRETGEHIGMSMPIPLQNHSGAPSPAPHGTAQNQEIRLQAPPPVQPMVSDVQRNAQIGAQYQQQRACPHFIPPERIVDIKLSQIQCSPNVPSVITIGEQSTVLLV